MTADRRGWSVVEPPRWPREETVAERHLSPAEAARVFDRIGRLQDSQGSYERRAVEELLRRGAFERAAAVVELGWARRGGFSARRGGSAWSAWRRERAGRRDS
jgi:hypothetical protein